MSTCLVCPPPLCETNCPQSKLSTAVSLQASSQPSSATKSASEELPTEIRELILSYLDFETIKNIRLTSKVWSLVARPFILSPYFTALQCRDDFERLREVSKHPYFSTRIKTLSIRSQCVDEMEFRYNLNQYRHSRKKEQVDEALARFEKVNGLIELFEESFGDLDILSAAFSKLTSLEALDIRIDECLYGDSASDGLFCWAWKRNQYLTPTGKDAKHSLHELLTLIELASAHIKHFSHDRVPSCFFENMGASKHVHFFSNLTSVKLNVEGNTGRGLVTSQMDVLRTLKLAQNLEELSIQFSGTWDGRLLHLQSSELRNTFWPSLHTLILIGPGWAWPAMEQLFISHAGSLRRLRISISFDACKVGWHSLLDTMKGKLSLEKLDYINRQYSLQPLYDEQWNRIPPLHWSDKGMKIEDYVINGVGDVSSLSLDSR